MQQYFFFEASLFCCWSHRCRARIADPVPAGGSGCFTPQSLAPRAAGGRKEDEMHSGSTLLLLYI